MRVQPPAPPHFVYRLGYTRIFRHRTSETEIRVLPVYYRFAFVKIKIDCAFAPTATSREARERASTGGRSARGAAWSSLVEPHHVRVRRSGEAGRSRPFPTPVKIDKNKSRKVLKGRVGLEPNPLTAGVRNRCARDAFAIERRAPRSRLSALPGALRGALPPRARDMSRASHVGRRWRKIGL